MGFLKDLGDIATGGLISGAGSVVGGVLESRAQNKATDAATASADKAIAFQREQSAKGDAAYQQQMQMWQASRQALLDKYGIDIAPPSMSGPGGGAPGAVPRGGPVQAAQGQAPAGMFAKGQSLGQLAGAGGGVWNDWGSHGLRGGGGRA